MAELLYINSTLIDEGRVTKLRPVQEKVEFSASQLIAASMDVELNNVDGFFAENTPGGFFYGMLWFNCPVVIYDDVQNIYIWSGRLKNIIFNLESGSLTIRTTNYIRDLADTTLNYSSSSNVTPAAHILAILQDVVNVPDEFINVGSFNDAIATQTANSAFVNMTFTTEKNQSALAVVEELRRMTQCHLYTIDNVLYLWQWRPWAGEIGARIPRRLSSYTEQYDEKKLINSTIVYYDNGGTAAKQTSTDASSIAKYGESSFLVPDRDVGNAIADYSILFKTSAGAAWAAALAVERYKERPKIFTAKYGDEYNWIACNDIVHLSHDGYSMEPARIIERSYDRTAGEVTLTGEFVNIPEVYSRDEEAPGTVEIVGVYPLRRGLMVKFTSVDDVDLAGYLLYFTASSGEWYAEFCNLGQSPVDVKNPPATRDGYVYCAIRELHPGTRYSVKIRSYDTSYNESADSNIVSSYVCPEIGGENECMLLGDPYALALSPDVANAAGGTVPAEFTIYTDFDSSEFDKVITGIYESDVIYSATGFTYLDVFGGSAAAMVLISWRSSSDGVTFDSWSTPEDACGSVRVAVSGIYLQYRFIYYSPSWGSSDYAMITQLEEAA